MPFCPATRNCCVSQGESPMNFAHNIHKWRECFSCSCCSKCRRSVPIDAIQMPPLPSGIETIRSFLRGVGSGAAVVVGSLRVEHHNKLLAYGASKAGLVPPATPEGALPSPVAVRAGKDGEWLRSFNGKFVKSRWKQEATAGEGVGTEMFGPLGFQQTEKQYYDRTTGRQVLALEHNATYLFGWIPLPTSAIVSVASSMSPHDDSQGWDLHVSSSLFGVPFVSYSGGLRLVPDSAPPTHPLRASADRLLHHVVVFDGVCSLCNASVDFILQHDTRDPPLFHFAPAQSQPAQALLQERGCPHLVNNLDSVLLIPAGDGPSAALPLTRSSAAIAIGSGLRWPFPWLAALAQLIPSVIRDALYDYIGKNRYRLFGKRDSCRMPRPGEVDRFLDMQDNSK